MIKTILAFILGVLACGVICAVVTALVSKKK